MTDQSSLSRHVRTMLKPQRAGKAKTRARTPPTGCLAPPSTPQAELNSKTGSPKADACQGRPSRSGSGLPLSVGTARVQPVPQPRRCVRQHPLESRDSRTRGRASEKKGARVLPAGTAAEQQAAHRLNDLVQLGLWVEALYTVLYTAVFDARRVLWKPVPIQSLWDHEGPVDHEPETENRPAGTRSGFGVGPRQLIAAQWVVMGRQRFEPWGLSGAEDPHSILCRPC